MYIYIYIHYMYAMYVFDGSSYIIRTAHLAVQAVARETAVAQEELLLIEDRNQVHR